MTRGEEPDPSLGHYPPRESESATTDWHSSGGYAPTYKTYHRASDASDPLRTAIPFAITACVIGLSAWGIFALVTREPEPAKVDAFAPRLPPGFDEIHAMTACDLNMRAQLVSPRSYRADWQREIRERTGVVAIRRGFAARNPMGVELRGTYTCLVGASTNRIVGLQYELAGRTVTVPGSELRT